jgi:hypothetical protein
LAFTEPGESEGPSVAEALGTYFQDVGMVAEIEVLDWAKVREMFRKKDIHCCIWPNIISWRPFEEFADIPLFWFVNEVVVNPKVVASWSYPGIGAGRSTHFHLLKAIQ